MTSGLWLAPILGLGAAELHDELRPVCQPLVALPHQVDVVDVLPQEVLRAVAGGVYVVADGPSALRRPAKGGVRTGEEGRQVEAPDVVCLPVAMRIRHLGDNPREAAGYRFGGPSLETYEHLKLGLAPRRRVGALPVKPPSQITQRDARVVSRKSRRRIMYNKRGNKATYVFCYPRLL